MTPLFEIRDLGIELPGRRLIERLSLDLPAGRVTALLGHNGSGKSTLLKALARQMPVTGTLRHRGRALADWPLREFARALAYLPQHLPAAEGMLVRELVGLGRYPWHGALGRTGPADRAAIDRAIALCGLGPLALRQVDTLSGGEAQRAWIAMLVAQEAGCLLLDEPISALDIAHQMEVLRLVRRMSSDEGRSVVVVLHDLNMAARFADHVVALKQGRLVFEGAPSDLMTPDVLQAIYGLPMEVFPRTGGAAALPL